MPNNEKRLTLLRQWELLKAIPSYNECPVGRTAQELTDALKDAGFDINVRSTQRDLNELSALFPIEANDKAKPYGWRWSREAHLGIPGLTVAEALALKLVEGHLRQLLPQSLLGSLEGLFHQADSKLIATQGRNRAADWLNKVRAVAPTLPMLPPVLDQAIHDKLSKALLEGRQVRVSYRSAGSDEAREYVLHPLGMVLRGAVLYLVATAFGYADVRTYAIHRFQSVDSLDDKAVSPAGFAIDQEIAKGMAEFGHWGGKLKLELLCDAELAFHLEETPLSQDQKIVPGKDQSMKVSVTVNDTWQLRWWLLSQGNKLEVVAPKRLREEIRKELEGAMRRYTTL